MENKHQYILADTNIWIEFFKKNSSISDNLELLITKDLVKICGVVLFEILQGIKSDTEKLKVQEILLNLPYIEMNANTWQKSAYISSSLKHNGYTIPFSDILIGALAIENNLAVFTLDKHFKLISEVKIYN
ncbi:MAG: type II toxin-antitoxin system VapC family toxin [bacterium]